MPVATQRAPAFPMTWSYLRIIILALFGIGLCAFAQAQTTYTYDALGRLVEVRSSPTPQMSQKSTYTYDPSGNRYAVAIAPPAVDCVNTYCAGNNSVIFRNRNGAGRRTTGGYYCAGAWWADYRDAFWISLCTTGWVPVSCDGLSGCPDTALPASPQSFGCVNNECGGYNSIVWPVQNNAGVSTGSQKYYCAGNWFMNVSGSNWWSDCETGWTPVP